MALQL